MRDCPHDHRHLRRISRGPQQIAAQFDNSRSQRVEKPPAWQPHLKWRGCTLLAQQIGDRCSHQNRQVRPRVLRKILNNNVTEITPVTGDWHSQLNIYLRPLFGIYAQSKTPIQFIPVQRNHSLTTCNTIIILRVIRQRHNAKRCDIRGLRQGNTGWCIIGHLHGPTPSPLTVDHDLTRSCHAKLFHCRGFLRHGCGHAGHCLLQREHPQLTIKAQSNQAVARHLQNVVFQLIEIECGQLRIGRRFDPALPDRSAGQSNRRLRDHDSQRANTPNRSK